MSEKHIYKVIFMNKDQVYEIYANNVYEGDMYGFVILEDLVFGEKNSIVLDTNEEKLRAEFEGVTRTFLPIHEIIRIDQVQKTGMAKIVTPSEKNNLSNISTLHKPSK